MNTCIAIVGLGRLGKVLAQRLAGNYSLRLYDRNTERAVELATELGAKIANNLEEAATCGVIILAVPDREVIICIKDLSLMQKELIVINVATNVSQAVLEQTAAGSVTCIGVKLVGHAGEMALGLIPVVIVNERPRELVEQVSKIFASVGHVVVGRADIVTEVNTIAAEKVLEAAVLIEDTLRSRGYKNEEMIQSAIRQVGAGILKAYADNDLGPFAQEIVRAVKAKMKENLRHN